MSNIKVTRTPSVFDPVNSGRIIDGVLEVWGQVPSVGDPAQPIVFNTTVGTFALPPNVIVYLSKDSGDSFACTANSITASGFNAKRANAVANGSNPQFIYRAIGKAA